MPHLAPGHLECRQQQHILDQLTANLLVMVPQVAQRPLGFLKPMYHLADVIGGVLPWSVESGLYNLAPP